MALLDFFKRQPKYQENSDEQNSSNGTNEAVYSLNEDIYNANVDDNKDVNDDTTNLINNPRVLTSKLLYIELPSINTEIAIDYLRKTQGNVSLSSTTNTLLFSFNDNFIYVNNVKHIAQCIVNFSVDGCIQQIREDAFRQNWHWKEAAAITNKCNYEILLSDTLPVYFDYKQRAKLFIDFQVAIIKASNPQVVYAKNAEKLIEPQDLIECGKLIDTDILHPLTNIRLFKVAEGETDSIVMDTIGLDALGLPDIEIQFKDLDPAELAKRISQYAYFVYDFGDIILNGETVDGIIEGKKWHCDKRMSILSPERYVIHIIN